MTERTAVHGMFSIERTYPNATPARVFKAFADPEAKARWFAGSAELTILLREMDFRVGGRERVKGRWPNGTVSYFNSVYQDIVPDERIVYSYDMELDGVRISVSMTTIEFKPSGKGSRLVFTEQDVFLDGFEDKGGREHGSNQLIDLLTAEIERAGAEA